MILCEAIVQGGTVVMFIAQVQFAWAAECGFLQSALGVSVYINPLTPAMAMALPAASNQAHPQV